MNNMSKITSFIENHRIHTKSHKNTYKLLEIINKVLVNAFLPPPQHILINTFVVFLENYYIFLIIIIFILYIFIKKNIILPNIIIFFCVSLGGLIIFFYTKFLGDTRHHGLIWIIFIISCWLSYKNDLDHIHILRNIRVKFSTIFTLLLIYHSLASIGPRINDYKKPYSNAKLAAEFIKLNKLQNHRFKRDQHLQDSIKQSNFLGCFYS
jgi:hypothetical protein